MELAMWAYRKDTGGRVERIMVIIYIMKRKNILNKKIIQCEGLAARIYIAQALGKSPVNLPVLFNVLLL